MRESIGATWIFSICLTFIVIFTAYLAISVNYAKAFRIKNHIINMIEENEGFRDNSQQRISDYLVSQGYIARGECPEVIRSEDGEEADWGSPLCINSYGDAADGLCNACIYRLTVGRTEDGLNACRSYYKVVTFFNFDLPVINVLTQFKVKGDSKLVYDFANPTC